LPNVRFVFGTRPEAIKMAPVVSAFRAHGVLFPCRVCVAVRHRPHGDGKAAGSP